MNHWIKNRKAKEEQKKLAKEAKSVEGYWTAHAVFPTTAKVTWTYTVSSSSSITTTQNCVVYTT